MTCFVKGRHQSLRIDVCNYATHYRFPRCIDDSKALPEVRKDGAE